MDRRSADLISRVTTSARRFKALIERITERYQPLPSLTHRSHFLFDVQLPLLEAYLSRITSSLDAYERLSSSFVRAVPGALAGQVGHGADTKRLTSGVEGLSRIVKALVSARWVKAAMEGWGEDLVSLSGLYQVFFGTNLSILTSSSSNYGKGYRRIRCFEHVPMTTQCFRAPGQYTRLTTRRKVHSLIC